MNNLTALLRQLDKAEKKMAPRSLAKAPSQCDATALQ